MNSQEKPIKILILSGSGRKNSHTDALARAVTDSLKTKQIKVELITLVDVLLPPADPIYHKDPFQNPDPKVKSLVESATEVDAFVLLSPIYHNSYSAILKNAIDHLSIKQFTGKPVALCSHGGDRSSQAVDHLRIVVRGLNGLAITTQVCTGDEDYVTQDNTFVLSSEKITARIERQTTELVALAKALKVSK